MLEVRLVEARSFIEVRYWPVGGAEECVELLRKLCDAEKVKAVDFVEAILFATDRGVVITGNMVDRGEQNKSLPISRFDRAWDEYFYRHAAQVSQAEGTVSETLPHTELVPLHSYLFRYDRCAFWTGGKLFESLKIPYTNMYIVDIGITALTRTLFNPLLTTRAVYKAMHTAGSGPGSNIVQDLLLPLDNSKNFMKYVEEELAIWPIWVCPVRKSSKEGDVCCWPYWRKGRKANEDELMLNFGVWGPGHQDPAKFKQMNRRLEEKLKELYGMKVLYAEVFYTEEEFWQLYDQREYDRLRAKYRATTLPSIWEKVKRKEVREEAEQDEVPRGRSASPKKSLTGRGSISPRKMASPS